MDLKPKIKILHLVLFSRNNDYDEMKRVTEIFYENFNDYVTTYYYSYKDDVSEAVVIENNNVYVKGVENIAPGILEKTLKTFHYISNISNFDQYTHIVRSNVSSIVNFPALVFELQKQCYNGLEFHYGGIKIENLQWTWPPGGLTNSEYFGTIYPQGTCIVFSKYSFQWLLKRMSDIKINVIDDVAIGILFQREWSRDHNGVKLIPIQLGSDRDGVYETLQNDDNKFKNQVAFRNKRNPRNRDVEIMTKICIKLSSMYKSTC